MFIHVLYTFFSPSKLGTSEWPFVMKDSEFAWKQRDWTRQSFQILFSSIVWSARAIKKLLLEEFHCSFLPILCLTCNNLTTLQHPTKARLKNWDSTYNSTIILFLFTLHKSKSHQEQNLLNRKNNYDDKKKHYILKKEKFPWTLFCLGMNIISPRNS